MNKRERERDSHIKAQVLDKGTRVTPPGINRAPAKLHFKNRIRDFTLKNDHKICFIFGHCQHYLTLLEYYLIEIYIHCSIVVAWTLTIQQ